MTADTTAKPPTRVAKRPNPYAGPRSLREDEAIYGRAREIEELRSSLLARRIVLLYRRLVPGRAR